MSFNEDVKAFATRIIPLKETISTEEATKMSMIIPLFQLMGYDVFNPEEFCPEYTADVGIKKKEKVDYAILLDNEAQILIECKWCGEELSKHGSQLFRYFSTTSAKFGILTNGLVYQFYTDLEESNKMDLKPFLEVDFENLNDTVINELKKFCKENFDRDSIFSTASELKYSSLLKSKIKNIIESPEEEFIRYILNDVYDGQKNQRVIEKFKPIVKRSFTMLINDMINQKISSALAPEDNDKDETVNEIAEKDISKIITTQEEIESFYIVRGILAGTTDIANVVYRDTESYLGILYKDNSRKPICRINLDTKKKQILIPDENKNFTRYYIKSLDDIYQYKDLLIKTISFYE